MSRDIRSCDCKSPYQSHAISAMSLCLNEIVVPKFPDHTHQTLTHLACYLLEMA